MKRNLDKLVTNVSPTQLFSRKPDFQPPGLLGASEFPGNQSDGFPRTVYGTSSASSAQHSCNSYARVLPVTELMSLFGLLNPLRVCS